MKNRYEIRGDITVIFLHRRNGPDLECLIDTTDLELVSSIPNSWNAVEGRTSKTHYARTVAFGSTKRIQMHNMIMNPGPGLEVDHLHHNGLDNRRCELAVKTRSGNALNKRAYNRPGEQAGRAMTYKYGGYQVYATNSNVNRDTLIGCFFDKELAELVWKVAHERHDGIPYPSQVKLASRVAKKIGVSRDHVRECITSGGGSDKVKAAIEQERNLLASEQANWLAGK